MKRIIAILTALWLLLGMLAGCGEKMLTPEEIFEKIQSADGVRMELVINYDDIQTSTTIIEEKGNVSRVYMETESFGAKSGEEYFLETLDGKRYIYTQTAEDQWVRSEWQEVFTAATIAGFSHLFESKLYYEEEGKYRMYDTATANFDGMSFNDVEIMLEKDGNYRLTAVVSQTIDQMPVFGSVTILFKLGDLSVQLPKVS